MATLAEVVAELEAFESPGQLAGYLESQHVTGVPNQGDYCPLAVYISDKTLKQVSVDPDGVRVLYVYEGQAEPEAQQFSSSLLAQFIDMFDNGECPNLEDDPY